MWAALRTHWDYFALAFLLGLYVTAALAVIALMLTLPAIFNNAGSVSGF
jgi:hypothetical protein